MFSLISIVPNKYILLLSYGSSVSIRPLEVDYRKTNIEQEIHVEKWTAVGRLRGSNSISCLGSASTIAWQKGIYKSYPALGGK